MEKVVVPSAASLYLVTHSPLLLCQQRHRTSIGAHSLN